MSSTFSENQPNCIPYVKRYRSRGKLYFYLRPPSYLNSLNGIFLGHSEDEARTGVERIMREMPGDPGINPLSIPRGMRRYQAAVMAVLSDAVIRARKSAIKRNLEFEIDDKFIRDLVEAQGWRCAVSGIRFRHRTEFGKPASREPFRPSIDRISNSRGYVPSNCRVVCVAVNVALGAWGDRVFNEIVTRAAEQLRRADPIGEFRRAAIRIVNEPI